MAGRLFSRFIFKSKAEKEGKLMHKEISKHLVQSRALNQQMKYALILIAIKDYSILKEMYGMNFTKQLERDLKTHLDDRRNSRYQSEAKRIGPGEVVVVVQQDTSPVDIGYRLKVHAQEGLKEKMLRHTGLGIDLSMGYATLESSPMLNHETSFESGLVEARRLHRLPLNMKELSLAEKFNSILTQKLITTAYQPILNFKSGKILGWEALTRGPKESNFHSPLVLFEIAEQLGRLFALEKLCRESAIKHIGTLEKGQKLFLNIHPKTMGDPEFTPGKTLELMEKAGLSPENTVFEITERHSVQDFDLFYRTLDHYRSQGFKIAIDDAGAGYAGLTTIAELQPEFIKLDKSLIDSIHKDPVKRALVETTVTFADKIGAQIIGEGIELKAQAICLKDIGVHCGQGYFLAHPDTPKPSLSKECTELQSVTEITTKSLSCSLSIGDIAKAPYSVQANNLVSDAQRIFKHSDRFSSVVVTEQNIPLGLVMEYHLNRQLSSPYGIALYYKRPVETVMDTSPLIIESTTPIEQAARKAMQRDPLKAYDDIIVIHNALLYGVVSVQDMLNAMAKIQVEMAKGTNPLTGLPGNVAIEKEVESRMAQKRRFSIIYADLDHFKVYNDTYGFKNGDQIIRLAADIMNWATKKHAGCNSQLCHIGGDDFVLITEPTAVDKLCLSITRCFGRLVKKCYCAEDQERGWIKAKGRDGKERNYPLVSISLGVIEIFGECSLMEIGERAAHIKKYAKSKAGNSVAIDRRPPLGLV